MGKRKDGRFYVKGKKRSEVRRARDTVGEMMKHTKRANQVYDEIVRDTEASFKIGREEAVEKIAQLDPGEIEEIFGYEDEDASVIVGVKNRAEAERMRDRRKMLFRIPSREKSGHSHSGMMQTEYCPVCQKYLKREDIP